MGRENSVTSYHAHKDKPMVLRLDINMVHQNERLLHSPDQVVVSREVADRLIEKGDIINSREFISKRITQHKPTDSLTRHVTCWFSTSQEHLRRLSPAKVGLMMLKHLLWFQNWWVVKLWLLSIIPKYAI